MKLWQVGAVADSVADPTSDRCPGDGGPGAMALYRRFVLRDFGADLRIAGKLAAWHIFAVPSVGAVMGNSAALATDPQRRSTNTSVMIGDLIEHGPDSPVGRETLRQMNRLHRAAAVTAEDHRYALAALTVVPVRWLDRYGRRPATAAERAAAAHFYHRIGELTGVARTPATYAGMAELFDATQRDRLCPNEWSRLASERTIDHIGGRLPRLLRRLVRPVLAVLLPEPVGRAVGLPQPPVLLGVLVRGVLTARRRVLRLLPVRATETTPRSRRGLPPAHVPQDVGTPA